MPPSPSTPAPPRPRIVFTDLDGTLIHYPGHDGCPALDPDAATFFWWIHAHGTMSSREIVVHVLDRYMTPEHAIEAFRSINTPGVTFDLADVERLIKAAGTWDPAATMAVAPD